MKDLHEFPNTAKAIKSFERKAKGQIWFTKVEFVSRRRDWHPMFECHVERIFAKADGFNHIRFDSFTDKEVVFSRWVEIPEGRNLDPNWVLRLPRSKPGESPVCQ